MYTSFCTDQRVSPYRSVRVRVFQRFTRSCPRALTRYGHKRFFLCPLSSCSVPRGRAPRLLLSSQATQHLSCVAFAFALCIVRNLSSAIVMFARNFSRKRRAGRRGPGSLENEIDRATHGATDPPIWKTWRWTRPTCGLWWRQRAVEGGGGG